MAYNLWKIVLTFAELARYLKDRIVVFVHIIYTTI
jgi:hypothetical protein